MVNKNAKIIKKAISVFIVALLIVAIPLQTKCYAYVPHTPEEEAVFLSDAIEEYFAMDDLYIKQKIFLCDQVLYAMINKAIKCYSFSESVKTVFPLYRTYVKCLMESMTHYENWAIDRVYISADIIIVSFYLFGFLIPSKYISVWLKR